MTAEEINRIIYEGSGTFGLRKTYCIAVNDSLPHSRDWDFENDVPSDNLLAGASCIRLPVAYNVDDCIDEINKALEVMQSYPGDALVLVNGDFAGLGDDADEILIANGVAVLVEIK
jgi:hypothetical protein